MAAPRTHRTGSLLVAFVALLTAWPGIPPGPIYIDATTVEQPTCHATAARHEQAEGDVSLPAQAPPVVVEPVPQRLPVARAWILAPLPVATSPPAFARPPPSA